MVGEEDTYFFGLAYQEGKGYIVFRFNIEYSCLMDFGPRVIIIGLFIFIRGLFES
jgi:hypothetical protein